jgi:hypothetical protein
MCLAWLLWLLDLPDPPPARTSAGIPPPGAGRHGATPPAASGTRVSPCPGESLDPGVAALGWGRRGWPKSPSAACQNSRSGFGEIGAVFSDDLQEIGLPKPGPRLREGRGLFSPVADVGLLGPRVASHERLGWVVPGRADLKPVPPRLVPERAPALVGRIGPIGGHEAEQRRERRLGVGGEGAGLLVAHQDCGDRPVPGAARLRSSSSANLACRRRAGPHAAPVP